jgi:tetratricopeptide (TPR) repeat protein
MMPQVFSMSRFINRIIFAATLALILCSLTVNHAFAQGAQCGQKREVGGKALDEATWKQLNRVYEDVGEERYDEAYNQLAKMLTRAGRDVYLQAVLNQALAQVEWSRENYDPSLKYFEKAVELDALPDQTHFALMYQIAQLYFMKERYTEALEKLELWFCTAPEEKITSSAFVLKASIYAAMEDYKKVLEAIEIAIGMEDTPKEPWWQLKLAAHYELEQFPQAATTLEFMVEHWPDKKMYWTQLSQTYFKLKQDEKALAVVGLAYRKGLLDKQGDITYLSNLYSHADVPYKSAEVLQKGIEDGLVEPTEKYWTAVADAWYAAEELEKSLAAYEKAGAASLKGEIDLRRGYILTDLERWPLAKEALTSALDKGGLNEKKTGEAYLLRGMAEFNLGNFDSASSDWGKASRYARTKDAAQQWMNHLREERRRRAP